MCWSIPLIDTWSTLHRPLIDTRSTSQLTVGRESTSFGLMHMSRSTLGGLSTDCWSSVNRVSNEYQLGCWMSVDQDFDWVSITGWLRVRGTQRIVSVNYLFGRPLIPSDFLKRIVASNVRDMRNSMSVVFGLLKIIVLGTEKRSAIIFGKVIRPKVFGEWTKKP